MEKVIKNKSVASALRIVELYKDCDKIDKEGLIMCFLDEMKESDYNRFKRIIMNTLFEENS